MAAPDEHGAIVQLLERQLPARRAEHRCQEVRHPFGDHQHGGLGAHGHRLAGLTRDGAAPGAGSIDQKWRREAPRGALHGPHPVRTADPLDPGAGNDGHAQRVELPAERRDGPERAGGPVSMAYRCADASRRDAGNQLAQLAGPHHLFVVEAQLPQLPAAALQARELLLRLGNLHLTAGNEATVVIHQLMDGVPQLHGRCGQRNLRVMTAEAPHAPGVDARCVPARVVFLQHHGSEPCPRHVKRGRQPVQTAAHDDGIRRRRRHRSLPAGRWWRSRRG